MPPVRHTYRENHGAYECRLHELPCFARPPHGGPPCDRRTSLHPLCPAHARQWLGLEIRPSGVPGGGCGLFTTRALRTGDLVAPYLGMVRPADDARCRHARRRGPGPRPASPYGIEIPGNRLRDASCERSYASMANHRPPHTASNCAFHSLHVKTNRHCTGGPDPAAPPGTRTLLAGLPGCRSVPTVLRLGDRQTGGLNTEMVWLVATRNIAANRELLVNYGPPGVAAGLLALSHSTTPPLC